MLYFKFFATLINSYGCELETICANTKEELMNQVINFKIQDGDRIIFEVEDN